MRYVVLLLKTDEGYAISCPGLPGCWSQGETEGEALENIKDAITGWLDARDALLRKGAPGQIETILEREVEVVR